MSEILYTMDADEIFGVHKPEKAEKATTVNVGDGNIKSFRDRVAYVREKLSEAHDHESLLAIKDDLIRTAKADWRDDFDGMRMFIIGETSRVADGKKLSNT